MTTSSITVPTDTFPRLYSSRTALRAGVIPRGLLHPTVGFASTYQTKKDDRTQEKSAETKGAGLFFAQVLKRKEEQRDSSQKSEFALADFEVIISSIRAVMK